MRDSDGVFTQFHEALRLPGYFGWNWDACWDCLCDLHWLKAAHFLVTIDDADAVLSEAPEERGILWRALDDAVTFWAGKPDYRDRRRSPSALYCCARARPRKTSVESFLAGRSPFPHPEAPHNRTRYSAGTSRTPG
ncbi:barstar family protein [Streptomyces sp. NPDC002076]